MRRRLQRRWHACRKEFFCPITHSFCVGAHLRRHASATFLFRISMHTLLHSRYVLFPSSIWWQIEHKSLLSLPPSAVQWCHRSQKSYSKMCFLYETPSCNRPCTCTGRKVCIWWLNILHDNRHRLLRKSDALKLIHTATPDRQNCLVWVASASVVWFGFPTTQDCRRQKIWSLNTLVAIVQFARTRQTRHRQDCFVVSGVAVWTEWVRQPDCVCVWSVSDCVGRRRLWAMDAKDVEKIFLKRLKRNKNVYQLSKTAHGPK